MSDLVAKLCYKSFGYRELDENLPLNAMKINEKNMVAFATSATPVDREGWLNKRGEVNRGYQRRWFVLKGNILFYFDRRGDKEPVGMIVLEGCTIELAEDEEQFGFKIVFHGPNNRSYALAAESQVNKCSSYFNI